MSAPAPAGQPIPGQERQRTPLPEPTPTSVPPERAALTDDEQAKLAWLLHQAENWTCLEEPKEDGDDTKKVKKPKKKKKKKGDKDEGGADAGRPDADADADADAEPDPGGPLTDPERMWLTRECLLRYLRATRWNQAEAERRLIGTLLWRRSYGIGTTLSPDHISAENETGKQLILGYDGQARPCQYLNPGRQNTEPSPRQVQHLVYMVERVIDMMPPGQETLALLINFKQGSGSGGRSNTAPGIGQAREVLHILQTHYPERLGRALIINVPWVVWGFFKLITPFIDPVTRDKLKFNEDMTQYVPREQLWAEWGGDLPFEYDHATYWPALTELCEHRQAERMARWIAAGSKIGELEDYLAGKLVWGEEEKSAAAAVGEAVTKEGGEDQKKGPGVGDLRVADLRIE